MIANNLKITIATFLGAMIPIMAFSFWFGVRIATAEERINTLSSKQETYDKTQAKLMTTINDLSINVERIAIKMGVETK